MIQHITKNSTAANCYSLKRDVVILSKVKEYLLPSFLGKLAKLALQTIHELFLVYLKDSLLYTLGMLFTLLHSNLFIYFF